MLILTGRFISAVPAESFSIMTTKQSTEQIAKYATPAETENSTAITAMQMMQVPVQSVLITADTLKAATATEQNAG